LNIPRIHYARSFSFIKELASAYLTATGGPRIPGGCRNCVVKNKSKPAPRPLPAEPADAINRHLGGRVKHLRGGRGWSLEALANASGVSRSMLSQIEREQANPTLAVTLRIARAFGLTLGELLEMPGAASAVTVIHSNDHTYHYRSDKDCRIRTLSPLNLEKEIEFYEIRLQPGGTLRSSAHFEGTREFLTLQKGRLRIESAADSEELAPGDSASYRADVPHAVINIGKTESISFLIVIYR
jgi:transcriptional regulator with XRE-family HTH domain